ncbi:hypothetical protein OSB04_027297 [Centaurea solstitialis]|uniref:Peptidase A1 domain-containing protein n=1 Tax=Centaurea solstitialis TaxID=347529 RepID=A0AA38SQK8_9ASTR|nr:hypothetical protein OSB04_027297 [Centaurea solstitialis]
MARFTWLPASFTTATIIVTSILLLFNDLRPCLFVSAIADGDPSTIILRPPHAGSNRHTMFLPLFPSPPNASRISSFSGDGKSRRHLQKSDTRRSNARMALHDDLLVNGYYTTRLWIGSPPRKFALIVDTGSTVTYVPCSTCKRCGKHQDPKFDPEKSSTYKYVKCNSDCMCDTHKKHCMYEREYAEMSTSSGVLGEDIISFGNQSELSPQRATFGCETKETGDLYSQRADGIIGLGGGDLSIVDQLVDKGVISNSFSLCYGGMDVGGGAMVLGSVSPPSGTVYSYSDPVRSPYYNVELKELHVAGKKLPLSPSVFDGKHGTVLDSGTTYAYLPEDAYIAFKRALMKELRSVKHIKGPDPSYMDTCFSGASNDVSELGKTFPTIDLVFGNGQKLSLSLRTTCSGYGNGISLEFDAIYFPFSFCFLFAQHSKVRGAYCLGIFANVKDPTTLLGGIVTRNIFVTYDREHEKIGFWRTNCSELWERLHASSEDTSPSSSPSPSPSPSKPPSSPSSSPSPSDGSPSSDDTSPPSPPPETPFRVTPGGEAKVGSIIFYMSLNINHSTLEPHIVELVRLIAKGLRVDPSQVELLDFTSKGNISLTIWSIVPPKPDPYMSKATASAIIARIAEGDIHLPKRFGKYHISNWFTDSEPNRTWWEKYSVVVIVLMVASFLGLAAVVAWWRWRQLGTIPYRPVDAGLAEAELEPL